MANLRIIPLNHFDSASNLTATTEAAGMGLANAQLPVRSRFYRSTSTAAHTLQGNWAGGARSCSAFALFRHNCFGGTVRLQLYSDIAWTTQAYDSTALTVPTVTLGSFDWGTDPLGTTSTDPLYYEQPYVLYHAPTTALSWRITLGGAGGLGLGYWQIGRIWLGRYWEVAANMAPGMELSWQQAAERSRSRGGSLRTSSGAARWRTLALDFRTISEADRVTWLDLMAQVGLERDIVISAFAGVGGRRERDYTLNAKFASADPISYGMAYHTKRAMLEEV